MTAITLTLLGANPDQQKNDFFQPSPETDGIKQGVQPTRHDAKVRGIRTYVMSGVVAGILQDASFLEDFDRARDAALVGPSVELVCLRGKDGNQNPPPKLLVSQPSCDQKTGNHRGVIAIPVAPTKKSAGFAVVQLVGGGNQRAENRPRGFSVPVFKPMEETGQKVGGEPGSQNVANPVPEHRRPHLGLKCPK